MLNWMYGFKWKNLINIFITGFINCSVLYTESHSKYYIYWWISLRHWLWYQDVHKAEFFFVLFCFVLYRTSHCVIKLHENKMVSGFSQHNNILLYFIWMTTCFNHLTTIRPSLQNVKIRFVKMAWCWSNDQNMSSP